MALAPVRSMHHRHPLGVVQRVPPSLADFARSPVCTRSGNQDRLPPERRTDHLQHQTSAVFQRAAVFVVRLFVAGDMKEEST